MTARSNSSSVCTSTHSSASFFHHFSASPWCAGADADTLLPLDAGAPPGSARAATALADAGVSQGASIGGRLGSMPGPGPPRRLQSSGPQSEGRCGARWGANPPPLLRDEDAAAAALLLLLRLIEHAGVRIMRLCGPAHVGSMLLVVLCIALSAAAAAGHARSSPSSSKEIGFAAAVGSAAAAVAAFAAKAVPGRLPLCLISRPAGACYGWTPVLFAMLWSGQRARRDERGMTQEARVGQLLLMAQELSCCFCRDFQRLQVSRSGGQISWWMSLCVVWQSLMMKAEVRRCEEEEEEEERSRRPPIDAAGRRDAARARKRAATM